MAKTKTKIQDSLSTLRKRVAHAQGRSQPQQVDDRSLIAHLLVNVDWQNLLPIVIPLFMQMLRGRHSVQGQLASALNQLPRVGQAGAASGASMNLGGLVGSLLGGGNVQSAQQANQFGGLLGLLGACPEPQRAVSMGAVADHLASNVDLDGNGVPDVLEKMLGSSIQSDAQKNGAATLLEQLLSNASP